MHKPTCNENQNKMSCVDCENCSCAKCIPLCINELEIGNISSFDENVLVIFEEIASGRKDVYTAKSDGTGRIKLDVDDTDQDIRWKPEQQYNLWIVLVSNENDINDNETITMPDATEVECLLVTFDNVFDENNVLKTFASHQITLC